MPATTYNSSTGVRVPVDRVHKGPGQAGNKSALTYRCDIGIPGYTGFIPQTAAIPLQVKGSTKYIGRLGPDAHQEVPPAGPPNFHTTSWYQEQFKADPEAYQKPSKDIGGYWIAKASQECSRPFSAKTTYQCELQHGGPTAQQQLASTVGLRSTVSCYDGARRGPSSGSIKSVPASVRQPLGFRTMYSSMHGEQIELSQGYAAPHTTTAAQTPVSPSTVTAAATPQAFTAADCPRIKTHGAVYNLTEGLVATETRTNPPSRRCDVVAAHPPREDVGSHTTDFGAYGDDVLSRAVGAAADMTQTATTHDLAVGTVRATKQVPGYTGFVPESDHNPLACFEASAVQQPRNDGKASSMLFTLDQYSRQRVPLYTGHRPHALGNLSVVEPAHGPTTQTTQGYANMCATQRPHTVDNSNFLDSRKGTMGFFNAGSSLFASENGLAEAQRFFQSKRGRRAGR